jgi:hypothetical protein
MDDRERRLRELAYEVWEEAGRPAGQEERHWSEAEKRYATEQQSARPSGKAPAQPRSTAKKDKTGPAPAEDEAAAAAVAGADAGKAAASAGTIKPDPEPIETPQQSAGRKGAAAPGVDKPAAPTAGPAQPRPAKAGGASTRTGRSDKGAGRNA